MSIWSTINGVDEDEPCGAPYRYPGSHLVPSADWPRGGEVMLAQVPSHITRDGRDDQPEDGTPWPWLRLSVLEPDVVLDVAQVRHLIEQLTGWVDRTQPAGREAL